MEKNFKEVGKWWNSQEIDLIEKDGAVYALNGWNGESYTESWKCSGEHNMDATGSYDIRPVYNQLGEDEFEVVDYEIN